MSVGGIRQLVVQITSTDEILMGYCMSGQVRTMMSSVMYNSKLNMGKKSLSRFLMMPCEMLLRSHLRNTRRIYLLGSGRGRVSGLGYAL